MSRYYAKLIHERLAERGLQHHYDIAHVEAWMRLEHGTLDALSPERFREEVVIACRCIAAAPIGESDALAQSYGLVPSPRKRKSRAPVTSAERQHYIDTGETPDADTPIGADDLT